MTEYIPVCDGVTDRQTDRHAERHLVTTCPRYAQHHAVIKHS